MNMWKNLKKRYHLLQQLLGRIGWGWDDNKKLPVPPDEGTWVEAIASDTEYKTLLGKPFEYKEQMDILCGKTMARGSLVFNSNAPIFDLDDRRSFGDDESPLPQQRPGVPNWAHHTSMGHGGHETSLDVEKNFNPFVMPTLEEHTPYLETTLSQFGGQHTTQIRLPSQQFSSGTGEYTPSPTAKRPTEDEATSPNKVRDSATPFYRRMRQKRNKNMEGAVNALERLCSLNDERWQLHKSTSVLSASLVATTKDPCSIKMCLQKLKSLPGYTHDMLYKAAIHFKDVDFIVIFMALDDEDKLGWVFYEEP